MNNTITENPVSGLSFEYRTPREQKGIIFKPEWHEDFDEMMKPSFRGDRQPEPDKRP